MRHVWTAILGGVLFTVACVQAESLTPSQRDWLRQRGKIVFVGDTDYPPYTFVGTAEQARGLDVDVAQAVGSVLGVPVEFRSVPWSEAIQQVLEGRADALAGMAQSDDRRDVWSFVEPHSDVQYFLFIREDSHAIHEIKDLEGMRVGVGKGSLVEPSLRADPKITVVNYDRGRGVEELVNREIAAFAGNLLVQSYFIETRNIRDVKVVGSPLIPPLPYGMAVPRGHDELLGILNAAVRDLRANGELATLQRKWFGEVLRPALISRRNLRWLWISLGSAAGIAVLGLLRAWELRRTVRRKTARISALRSLGRSFGEQREVAGVLDRAMDVLEPLMKPDSLFVVVGNREQRIVRHGRLPEALVKELDSPECFDGDGIVARVFREGAPIVGTGDRLVTTSLSEMGFRTVACLPVIAESKTLGVLGVLSRGEVRLDSDFQQAVAAELGIAVANASLFATLEHRVAERTQQLNERNQQLEADLNMAREVQVALQPMMNCSAVEIARHNGSEPIELSLWNRSGTARTVGGDFFSIMRPAPDMCGVFICDVMGQGARAALLTAIIRTALDDLTDDPRDAKQFMAGLNLRLVNLLKTQETPIFATAFYACFDLARRQVTFANAGHPWPLVLHRTASRVEMMDENQPHGPALGLFDDAEFPALTRSMTAGEVWLLYTDGLYEPANPKGESFGMERVQSLLDQQLTRPLSEVLDNLMHDLIHFTGAEEVDDDVCVVAVEARRGSTG